MEWSSETNYHFKLSAFKDRLLSFYQENPNFIRPQRYMKNVVDEVSAGLQDLSISRPVSRLNWGIPVPGDETQTIYVWLDALINYLTYAGYPCTPGQEGNFMWPADVHVIGKDIVRSVIALYNRLWYDALDADTIRRFHCIYWPAFLMALDLPPPRQILTHPHWTLNHQKMSKSTGNAVSPTFAMERFGVDTVRSYLVANGGVENDADYDNSYIVRHYKAILQRGLGNVISRLVRSKKWSVRDAVIMASQGALGESNSIDLEHEKLLRSTASRTQDRMDRLELVDAAGTLAEIAEKVSGSFLLTEYRPLLNRAYRRINILMNPSPGALQTT